MIEALKPVAWHVDFGNDDEPNYVVLCEKPNEPTATVRPLVFGDTTPQRTWVGLTDEDRDAITDEVIGFNSCCGWEDDYAKAIEAKLKQKNNAV